MDTIRKEVQCFYFITLHQYSMCLFLVTQNDVKPMFLWYFKNKVVRSLFSSVTCNSYLVYVYATIWYVCRSTVIANMLNNVWHKMDCRLNVIDVTKENHNNYTVIKCVSKTLNLTVVVLLNCIMFYLFPLHCL